ncbi:MAG: hypothetical protein RIR22_731, partial [Planctomycetota bacterium]
SRGMILFALSLTKNFNYGSMTLPLFIRIIAVLTLANSN